MATLPFDAWAFRTGSAAVVSEMPRSSSSSSSVSDMLMPPSRRTRPRRTFFFLETAQHRFDWQAGMAAVGDVVHPVKSVPIARWMEDPETMRDWRAFLREYGASCFPMVAYAYMPAWTCIRVLLRAHIFFHASCSCRAHMHALGCTGTLRENTRVHSRIHSLGRSVASSLNPARTRARKQERREAADDGCWRVPGVLQARALASARTHNTCMRSRADESYGSAMMVGIVTAVLVSVGWRCCRAFVCACV